MSPATAPRFPDGPGTQDRPARILIAEDDRSAARVLETLLNHVGYDVTVAAGGAEALQRLDEGLEPDALLLDWMLPEVSGLDVCLRVRERWDRLTLPILMVTARADAASIAAAFDAGASDYLTKPFMGAELRARVAAHLRIKQLVEERRRMNEHLMERERLSALGLLVGSVAHDLNNPLMGISGYAQLLLDDEADAGRRAALGQVLQEVERCHRIVGNLLDFARRRAPERYPVDVAEVLCRTVELRERSLRGSGIRVELDLEPGGLLARADPHQLQQVFLNLLINAEQALREGGTVLRVEARRTLPPEAGGRPVLEVRFFNDGPAIPADVLPYIFEPLFTTKDKGEGTGLGLAIARRVVREHGGEIEVESGDRGAEFRIRLPMPDMVAG